MKIRAAVLRERGASFPYAQSKPLKIEDIDLALLRRWLGELARSGGAKCRCRWLPGAGAAGVVSWWIHIMYGNTA